MLFHRRALRAMGALAAALGFRAAGWNVTQQAFTERNYAALLRSEFTDIFQALSSHSGT